MICVQQEASGSLSVVNPQPVDVSTCSAVLATPLELSVFPPLSADEGFVVSGSILAVWAVAFSFRAIGSLFNVGSGEMQNE